MSLTPKKLNILSNITTLNGSQIIPIQDGNGDLCKTSLSDLWELYQPTATILTNISILDDSAGILQNDGRGNLSWYDFSSYMNVTDRHLISGDTTVCFDWSNIPRFPNKVSKQSILILDNNGNLIGTDIGSTRFISVSDGSGITIEGVDYTTIFSISLDPGTYKSNFTLNYPNTYSGPVNVVLTQQNVTTTPTDVIPGQTFFSYLETIIDSTNYCTRNFQTPVFKIEGSDPVTIYVKIAAGSAGLSNSLYVYGYLEFLKVL